MRSTNLTQVIHLFWQRHPALLLGIALLIGAGLAIHPTWELLIPIPFFLWEKQRIWLFLAGVLLAFSYTQFLHPHLRNPPAQKELLGKGYFQPTTLRIISSPFSHSYLYQGTLRRFDSVNGEAHSNLPCALFIPLHKERKAADRDYMVTGKLIKRPDGTFTYKATSWEPVAESFRLAEWRFLAKQKARTFLEQALASKQSATFFTSLLIGETDERLLAFNFGRLGMQHILGISGFLFSLVAFFCRFFLKALFSPKISSILLIALLTSYFFFLGDAPAIQRAWVAITLYLLAQIFHLPCPPLNALGLGLISEIVFDPLIVTNLGFQLSFLATGAIFLLYQPMLHLCALLFPKRKFTDVLSMPFLDRHAYLICAGLRKAFALNAAVHIATLPVILFLFYKLPLLSFLYNLFFPFWVSILLFLLLAALPIYCILPPVGSLFLQLISYATEHLLDLTAHPPAYLDLYLRWKEIPLGLVIGIVCVLFQASIVWGERESAHRA